MNPTTARRLPMNDYRQQLADCRRLIKTRLYCYARTHSFCSKCFKFNIVSIIGYIHITHSKYLLWRLRLYYYMASIRFDESCNLIGQFEVRILPKCSLLSSRGKGVGSTFKLGLGPVAPPPPPVPTPLSRGITKF